MIDKLIEDITKGKNGVEIGGPSAIGKTVYDNSANVDNVIFSKNTIWSQHTDEYHFSPGKIGKVIINDAVDINKVGKNVYDYCFSSHCLEHIANPLKAVKEWLRIVKSEGYLIIIVPEKSECFDHRRNVTPFKTLLNQYFRNVKEDDLSTLPEILTNHDLSMDLAAGDFESFTKRSLSNFTNRCLHHYVYSPALLHEICDWAKCEFIYTNTYGLNMCFIMKKK